MTIFSTPCPVIISLMTLIDNEISPGHINETSVSNGTRKSGMQATFGFRIHERSSAETNVRCSRRASNTAVTREPKRF